MQTNRRSFKALMAFLLPAALATGACETALAQQPQMQPGTSPITVLTQASNGETVVLHVGDVVAVRLAENVAGATWSVKNISNAGAKLLGTLSYDTAQTAYTGNFQAVQPGVVAITLMNVQPGTADQNPIAMFSFTLNVENTPAGSMAAPPGAAKFVPASFENRETGTSVVTYPDGASYTGGLAQGLPSGPGTFSYSSSDTGDVVRASGNWNGAALSDGDLLLRNGVRYFGGLDANGKVDGPARFDLPDGAVLATSFQHGDYSGLTTWQLPNDTGSGAVHQSTLVVDVNPPSPTLTGPATEMFSNDSRLVGTMQNGQFEGPGTFTSGSLVGYGRGPTFNGNFTDGILQGPYRWTDSDGSLITGFMRDGTPSGSATLTSPRGQRCAGRVWTSHGYYEFDAFDGSWDNEGRPNSRGTYGCPGREQTTGQWTHGKMVGLMVDRAADGTMYKVNVGPQPSPTLTGPATITMPNGDVATGFLRSDRAGAGALNGTGSYTFAEDNYTAHGTWHDGAFTEIRE